MFLEGELNYVKVCYKCKTGKASDHFSRDKSRHDGLQPICKTCAKEKRDANKEYLNEASRRRYSENREAVIARTSAYYKDRKDFYKKLNSENYKANRDERRARGDEYYRENIDVITKRQKEYRDKNRELINERARQYRVGNEEKYSQRGQKYYAKNREKVLERTKAYKARRLKSDPVFAMISNVRSRVNEALKSKGVRKSMSSNELVGCTWAELVVHLERQFFPGMSWDNRGEWHIDHIVPVANAKTFEGLVPLLHFTNLRPLWAKDNLKKSSKFTHLI